MTQQVPERTVVINGSDGGGGGGMGMGMGMVVGILLVIVLMIGAAWFVMSGRMAGSTTPATNISPTINIAPPDIKVPDTITINPGTQPAPKPAQ